MKLNALLVGLATAGIAASTYGQGLVNFVNGVTSVIQINTTPGTGNVTLASASSTVYGTRIQLYYSTNAAAPSASSSANGFGLTGWTAVGSLGTAISSIGHVSVGSVTIPNSVGVNIWLEAIGWSGASAQAVTTYTTLAAALADSTVEVGSSGVWQQLTGNPNSTPPGTPVSTASFMNALGNIKLDSVPEPTTLALAGLGSAALLMFRRK